MKQRSEITDTNDAQALFKAVLALKNMKECELFFRDVCTVKEIRDMASRYAIARMLNANSPKPYLEIARETGASTATVTRVAHWLHHGMGGYRLALERTE
jgi:TrpR-related protein YerC/YecD